MEIIRNADIQKTREAAARALEAALLQARGGAVLLLFSGGSAFEVLSGVSVGNVGGRLTIGALDERFDGNPDTNNFLQFKKTDFYETARKEGVWFIDSVPEENESLGEFAKKIEMEWKRWRKENENGTIIITQGIGTDGHTAGVMPFPEDMENFQKLFLDGKRWVRGYDTGAKNKYPLRATATLSFLKSEVDASIAYIAGDIKKSAFEKLLSETGTLAETPARVMREMKKVKIFTTII